MIPHVHSAGKHGSGDDNSGARQREAAVDREAETAVRGSGVGRRCGIDEMMAQLIDAAAGQGRNRQDVSACERRAGDCCRYLGFDHD